MLFVAKKNCSMPVAEHEEHGHSSWLRFFPTSHHPTATIHLRHCPFPPALNSMKRSSKSNASVDNFDTSNTPPYRKRMRGSKGKTLLLMTVLVIGSAVALDIVRPRSPQTAASGMSGFGNQISQVYTSYWDTLVNSWNLFLERMNPLTKLEAFVGKNGYTAQREEALAHALANGGSGTTFDSAEFGRELAKLSPAPGTPKDEIYWKRDKGATAGANYRLQKSAGEAAVAGQGISDDIAGLVTESFRASLDPNTPFGTKEDLAKRYGGNGGNGVRQAFVGISPEVFECNRLDREVPVLSPNCSDIGVYVNTTTVDNTTVIVTETVDNTTVIGFDNTTNTTIFAVNTTEEFLTTTTFECFCPAYASGPECEIRREYSCNLTLAYPELMCRTDVGYKYDLVGDPPCRTLPSDSDASDLALGFLLTCDYEVDLTDVFDSARASLYSFEYAEERCDASGNTTFALPLESATNTSVLETTVFNFYRLSERIVNTTTINATQLAGLMYIVQDDNTFPIATNREFWAGNRMYFESRVTDTSEFLEWISVNSLRESVDAPTLAALERWDHPPSPLLRNVTIASLVVLFGAAVFAYRYQDVSTEIAAAVEDLMNERRRKEADARANSSFAAVRGPGARGSDEAVGKDGVEGLRLRKGSTEKSDGLYGSNGDSKKDK